MEAHEVHDNYCRNYERESIGIAHDEWL